MVPIIIILYIPTAVNLYIVHHNKPSHKIKYNRKTLSSNEQYYNNIIYTHILNPTSVLFKYIAIKINQPINQCFSTFY